MTVLLLLMASAFGEPFIYDDGDVRCILLRKDPVGVHQEALARWAPRGELVDGEELEDCVPVEPRVVDCPEGLGAALPFSGPIDRYESSEGVKVARMSGDWLHVRGTGDVSVFMKEDGPPVLLRLKQDAQPRLPIRAGTVIDLGFTPDYIGGTGQLVRVGSSLMVLSAGDVYLQKVGEPPVAYAVAPENRDPQMVLRPGQSRAIALDDTVVDVIVGDPMIAGAVIRGRRVKVSASAAGETRIAMVLESGRILPVRVIVR